MKITFSGGEADQHRIDLYEGSQALSGIGRVGTLVGHYVATGQVRYRAPYSNRFGFFLSGTENGSLTVLVSEISRLTRDGGTATANAAKLLRKVINRAIGKEKAGTVNLDGMDVPAGDLDALAEAAGPGLITAHRWISHTKQSISIDTGHPRSLKLDTVSKDYLNTEQTLGNGVQDVSVGALNVNSRNGRVYFHDLKRTVPFYVAKTARDRTIPTLSRFLTQYAEKTGATVNIKFEKIGYPDGRLKRIVISDCYSLEGHS